MELKPSPGAGPQLARMPLDLPQIVMHRAAAVAAVVLLLALALGWVRAGHDIDEEVAAAMSLATLMAQLSQAQHASDAQALEALRRIQSDQPLRHLGLHVASSSGQALLVPAPERPASAWVEWLSALHRRLEGAPDARRAQWVLPRPDGTHWTVSLWASHEAERQEAMGSLLGMMALLLMAVGGMLAVMRWNLRQAFAPLGTLLDAIAGIEVNRVQSVQQLPTMPIRELESVAAALRHLAGSLSDTEARRRRLSEQLQRLQEDERARLAQDLHDEFGQRLTALRVDTTWLLRRVADQPGVYPVVQGMAQQCALLQQDIRTLLARLQPFGPLRHAVGDGAVGVCAGDPGECQEDLFRLVNLLRDLVASWSGAGPAQGRMECTLVLQWQAVDGRPQAWPDTTTLQAWPLRRSLALAMFRISQEALTNVARHAQAQRARLTLRCRADSSPGGPLQIEWSVEDDGLGLPGDDLAWQRGIGLAGLQERIWAHGGDLSWGPATADPHRPGLRLRATLSTAPQHATPEARVAA